MKFRHTLLDVHFGERDLKTDWLIWLCCVALFGAGAVWGGVPIRTNFFVVANIHDLFEIISSIATVIAVVIAVFGLNAWKRQISATADHELARKVSIALSKYKDEVLMLWSDAHASAVQIESGNTSLDSKYFKLVNSNMKKKMHSTRSSRAELKALSIECKAIWGEAFEREFHQILSFERQCYSCVDAYLRWLVPSDNELLRSYSRMSIITFRANLNTLDLNNSEKAIDYIELITNTLTFKLQEKLLR